MRKFEVIAKEVGICLLLLVVALGVNAFLFKEVYFKTMDVPVANEYSTINRELYKVVGDIQDAQNATQTYEVSSSQIEDDLTEYRYTPGTVNPFVSSSSINDLPGETIKGGSTNTSANTNVSTNTTVSTDTTANTSGDTNNKTT